MNPNQTTYNTAFVLYVLSCVEVFPTLHTLFLVNFAGSLLWGHTCQVLRLSRFILDVAPARRGASVAKLQGYLRLGVSQIGLDHHHFRPDLDMLRDFGPRYPGRLTHRVSHPSQVVY